MTYIDNSLRRIERDEQRAKDREDARTGARRTFGYQPLESTCRWCGLMPQAHVVNDGILFCPEWALRDRWGR